MGSDVQQAGQTADAKESSIQAAKLTDVTSADLQGGRFADAQ